jgi:hypothetical protein
MSGQRLLGVLHCQQRQTQDQAGCCNNRRCVRNQLIQLRRSAAFADASCHELLVLPLQHLQTDRELLKRTNDMAVIVLLVVEKSQIFAQLCEAQANYNLVQAIQQQRVMAREQVMRTFRGRDHKLIGLSKRYTTIRKLHLKQPNSSVRRRMSTYACVGWYTRLLVETYCIVADCCVCSSIHLPKYYF